MPIVIDPGFTWPPPPETTTSSDGRLQARVTDAGVLLRADMRGDAIRPDRVRFVRGDGSLVRSGDPAMSPGGVALAFDHEAAPGEVAMYYAVPLDRHLRQAGEPTSALAVTMVEPIPPRDLWIKSPESPMLSMRVIPEKWPEMTFESQSQQLSVPGARLGVSALGVREGGAGTLEIVTESHDEEDRLFALLDSGVVLLQTRAEWHFRPAYVLPGSLSTVKSTTRSEVMRHSVEVREARRPPTADVPLRVPGYSWADVERRYTSYQDIANRALTYEQLAGWVV